MIKKSIKKLIITVLVISCAFLGVINTKTFATTKSENSDGYYTRVAGVSDIIDSGNEFIKKGKAGQSQYDVDVSPEGFVEQFIEIGQLLVAIAIVTMVIVSVIMAFKWITATPDKQAKLKGQLIGLVVAAIVIFGAVGIWNLVLGIMNNVENEIDHGNPYDSAEKTKITIVAEDRA